MNSKQKGARGERKAAEELRKHGFLSARRGQQYCGANGDADIVDAIPGIHIECKWVEKLNFYNAIEQAVNDCKDGELPAVLSKKNRSPWLVTMRLEDWVKMYKGEVNANNG